MLERLRVLDIDNNNPLPKSFTARRISFGEV